MTKKGPHSNRYTISALHPQTCQDSRATKHSHLYWWIAILAVDVPSHVMGRVGESEKKKNIAKKIQGQPCAYCERWL